MVQEWTKDQADQITTLYGELKGKHERSAHQKLFGGPQLPYLDAFNTLKGLIEQQEKEQSDGLERKVKEKSASHKRLFSQTSQESFIGLAVIVLSLFALYSMGVPYTLPPLY